MAQLEEVRQTGYSETSLTRLYIEAMEDILPRMKKYLIAPRTRG